MNSSFNIKTHRPGKEYSGVHFFILNKGLNYGNLGEANLINTLKNKQDIDKPLNEACPNCFVLECESEEQKESLYWICFALWQSHRFRQHLIGSVILYIRKKELLNLVRDSFLKCQTKPELFQKSLILLKTVNEKDHHFQELVAIMKKMKREVARELVR